MVEFLPNIRWLDSKPELVEFISSNRSADRIMQNVEYADPFWRIPMITAPLTQAERLELEAFKQLVGNGMTTVFYQPKHICVPRAYWGDANNPAVLNVGNLVSISNNLLTINSVTSGLLLQRGDLISLVSADGLRACLFQCTDNGIATGPSSTIVISVGPTVPSYFVPGAQVWFKNPPMMTRVVPGSFNIPSSKWASCSFELQEVPL